MDTPFLPFSCAVVTPFNAEGDLTEGAVRNLIGLLKSEGIPAFLVSGSTGEQHSMTVEERSLLYRWSAAEAGSSPVYAGVAAVRTDDAVAMAQAAAQAGAAAIMLGFPPYLRPTFEDVRVYTRRVCSATDLPVLVYNNPARTGFDLTPEGLVVLAADNPVIRAVKEAGGMDRAALHKKALGPGFGVFTGSDRTAAEAWAAGFDGLTSIAANLWPGPLASAVGDLTSGRVLQAAGFFASWADTLKTVVETQLPASLKYALRTAGRPGGWCREPLGHLSPAQEEAIAAALRSPAPVTTRPRPPDSGSGARTTLLQPEA